MAVNGISSRFGYLGLPNAKDMQAVLAARPSIAELTLKARAKAVAVAANTPTSSGPVEQDSDDDTGDNAVTIGASTIPGKVDMYL